MKTNELIDTLSADLKPNKGADSLSLFLAKCLLFCVGLLSVTFYLLPIRNDLSHKLDESRYYVESFLWFSCALWSGIIAYHHSIPGLSVKVPSALGRLTFGILLAVILTAGVNLSLISDLTRELDLNRSWCGPIIIVLGSIASFGLFAWVKNLAPTSYKSTGFWMATAGACIGSLAMQFVCAHDSAVHLYLWHVLPTLLLGITGAWIAGKKLRW